MTSRSLLVLAACAVVASTLLVLVVPRSLRRHASRSTGVVSPTRPSEGLETALVAAVDVQTSTMREQVLAGETGLDDGSYRFTILDDLGAPVLGAQAWVGGARREARERFGRVDFRRQDLPQSSTVAEVRAIETSSVADDDGIGFDLRDVPDSIEVPRGRHSVVGNANGNDG